MDCLFFAKRLVKALETTHCYLYQAAEELYPALWIELKLVILQLTSRRFSDTLLPPELLLVHEHTDHYSLQPAIETSLEGQFCVSDIRIVLLS